MRISRIHTFRNINPKTTYMKIISGDICNIKSGVIIHCVNCQSAMGAGVALALCTKWPPVRKDYIDFCKGVQDIELLGQFQEVQVTDSISVINVFGQLYCGSESRDVDYAALKFAFRDIAPIIKGRKVYIPYLIGAGLAGGDYKTIHRIIEKYLPDAILVKYKN